MKTLLHSCLLVALSCLLLHSCEKDTVVLDTASSNTEHHTVYFDINDLTGGPKSTIGLIPHVLGPERQNPLTVENLNLAEIQIKGSGGTHAATDLYVKFQPVDVDDLRELEEADLFLLDFPWTRELI
ncbi:hypothetical protein QWY85_02890 [Neolewinella lacunae]|uniref:Uncharacterized protein n=1 Tax=Neolewinella lacunae TaxID=1517758 RepID=A0A923PPG8_9BACT|nr:hypothetical protein [Neolewinella lacunae]MBC6996471.1 hypothetical protein [Neolewinella lacunae]MDN3633586.1 hypothetical protein [Neolewinella lacunae]